jgi:uncharacterized glyoxalase superfamily protein PhnB
MEALMSASPKRPTFVSALFYEDPAAALDWLERAFGFERSMVITDADGRLAHSEMAFGDGQIMVGSKWSDFIEPPAGVGGKNTQIIHVHLDHDVDAHCERARAAGAEILQEPQDQFYGDRTYRARDLGGHVWIFGQTVRTITPDEWDAASPGLTTKMYR